ncbi:hypothetical protein N8T08_008662 [Aspergillus melleus]|uniref:Uncharacterized protein n=1 Tax=Aspergillus melleus TaxID=138277 RepID=A0ACC3BEK2_9EURO|nr:hypothetical protein N8T08_008662 [Aspergillus melleus]
MHQAYSSTDGPAGSDFQSLLDQIDQLRDLNLEKHVKLPELVVIGDQSSGKSSVLEALSGFPLPISATICTRFPIRLSLRRSESISCRMKAGDWSKSNFEFHEIPDLIEEASDSMGITPRMKGSDVKQFSDRVLNIEIHGPDQPNFTLLNLPGVYPSSTADQNDLGRDLVKNLVETHIKDGKNILLLVVSAASAINSYVTPQLVQTSIPDLERTLGVVTHPDKAYDNDKTFELMRNENMKLKLGWYALRNRSSDKHEKNVDLPTRTRTEAEFFNQGRWRDIPEENKGIAALRTRLERAVFQHIRSHLPNLMSELRHIQARAKQSLDAMPPHFGDIQEQRDYLKRMAREFEILVRNAANGTYTDKNFLSFFGLSDKDHASRQISRLRSNIRELTRIFTVTMELCGRTSDIVEEDKTVSCTNGTPSELYEAESPEDIAGCEEEKEYEDENLDLDEARKPDLLKSSFLPKNTVKKYWDHGLPDQMIRKKFEEKAAHTMRCFRGKEAPSEFAEGPMSVTFIQETFKWSKITDTHFEEVWRVTEELIEEALSHCVDEYVLMPLKVKIVQKNLERLRERVRAKIDDLLLCHQGGNPGFLNTFSDFMREEESETTNTAVNEKISQGAMIDTAEDIFQAVGMPFMNGLVKVLRTKYVGDTLEDVVDSLSGLPKECEEQVVQSIRNYLHKQYFSREEEAAAARMVDQFQRYYKVKLA